MPLASLPPSPLLKPGADPLELLGLTSAGGLSPADLLNMLKLEAPLAVQARPPHAGFFPLNKFSTVPLMMKAARTASLDGTTDGKKDFMVLPDTHALTIVKERTAAGTWRMTGVDTSQGRIDLAPGGIVVIALGTIESARIALAIVRRQRPPDAAVHGQEPDRAPALESGVPRASGRDPRPVARRPTSCRPRRCS